MENNGVQIDKLSKCQHFGTIMSAKTQPKQKTYFVKKTQIREVPFVEQEERGM